MNNREPKPNSEIDSVWYKSVKSQEQLKGNSHNEAKNNKSYLKIDENFTVGRCQTKQHNKSKSIFNSPKNILARSNSTTACSMDKTKSKTRISRKNTEISEFNKVPAQPKKEVIKKQLDALLFKQKNIDRQLKKDVNDIHKYELLLQAQKEIEKQRSNLTKMLKELIRSDFIFLKQNSKFLTNKKETTKAEFRQRNYNSSIKTMENQVNVLLMKRKVFIYQSNRKI